MKQPIWFAILVGLIVVSAATFVFTIAVLSVFLIIHGRPGDTISQPVGLVVGALGVATGGFVAARMSGVRGMKAAIVVGSTVWVLGVASALYRSRPPSPWYEAVSLALTLGGSAFGAYLAGAGRTSSSA